jgi:hypothetical protein
LSQVYCPKKGKFKLLIDFSAKTDGLRLASEEETQMLSSTVIDIEIDFKECTLFPGSEVMIL